MPRHRRPARFQRLRSVAPLTLSLALALMAGVAVTQTAYATDNPFERGPNPTPALVNGNGPFATAIVNVPSSVPGFGSGTIYYPTTPGTYGGVALAPGFTARWTSIAWLGPRIASHGFVVIGIDTNSLTDQTASRGQQLQAALDYLTRQSSVRTRVDASRVAVGGHGLGADGALAAANLRPALRAVVALAPSNATTLWPNLRVNTMIIAPESANRLPLYDSIPAPVEKAYRELRGANGLLGTSPNADVSRESVVWLKRFVDNDVRYDQFICPTPTGGPWSRTRGTCPTG